MKKKVVATIVTLMMAASLAACGSSSSTTTATSTAAASSSAAAEETTEEATSEAAEETAAESTAAEADFGDLEAEYEPNADYDKYTLVDYTIEDIDAQFIATVSAKEDGSEYEVHCNFYGDEQVAVVDGDGNVISDKTGFMETDAPIIVQNAIDADNWATIG